MTSVSVSRGTRFALGCCLSSAVRLWGYSQACAVPQKNCTEKEDLPFCVSEASALPGPLPLLFQPVKVTAEHFLPSERESELRSGPSSSLTMSCSWEPPPSRLNAFSGRSGRTECRLLARIRLGFESGFFRWFTVWLWARYPVWISFLNGKNKKQHKKEI